MADGRETRRTGTGRKYEKTEWSIIEREAFCVLKKFDVWACHNAILSSILDPTAVSQPRLPGVSHSKLVALRCNVPLRFDLWISYTGSAGSNFTQGTSWHSVVPRIVSSLESPSRVDDSSQWFMVLPLCFLFTASAPQRLESGALDYIMGLHGN
ncbi:hypothetical protein NPIL_414011 [Nephila pilipes]|uniref:Uncharacterized protein n=1 Tax=Nephila pilipes TaxID=299642 RepID=A0A8X6TZ86_NEPPI|nr:hypothetical protein NPIL_414011 [Nephila pilipes]